MSLHRFLPAVAASALLLAACAPVDEEADPAEPAGSAAEESASADACALTEGEAR